MATIKDVAERCGVGTTTVSRVINNSSSVAEPTRLKVLQAMKELNYEPNLLARGLAGYNTYTIGLVMDNTIDKAYSNPFIYEIFRGIQKIIYENGYNLLLLDKDTCQNGKPALEIVLQGRRVDGIIVPCALIKENKDEYLEYNIPIVALGKLEAGSAVSYVDIDNFMAGYKASEYLYSRGYRNPAFEKFSDKNNLEKDRYLGYEAFVISKNLPVRIFESDFNDIDSIVCLNNLTTFKTLQLCKFMNKNVPDDIGLITFDNYPLAEYLEPTITNIEIDLYELGKQAAMEMLEKVRKKTSAVKEILIPVSINIRKSTK